MDIQEIKKEFNGMDTIPPTNETLAFISKILESPKILPNERYEFADIISELIDKLTDNYAHVTDQQSLQIVAWIDKNWDSDSLKYMDLILTILLNVNQEHCVNYLNGKLNSESRKEIRGMISEAMDEIKST